MLVTHQRSDDGAENARAGIEAGAELDDGSELPVITHVAELARG